MTNEDTTADVPISNWTLATRTKPGPVTCIRHIPGARLGMYSTKPSRRISYATRAGRGPTQKANSVRNQRFRRPRYRWVAVAVMAVEALRQTQIDRDETAPFNGAPSAPNFSPTSVHERPNTRENRGAPETREQDESTG